MSDKQSNNSCPSFTAPHINFEEWADLAQQNPEAFEARRKAVIEAAIAMADSAIQERLRRTQWKVDTIRKQQNNPMAACIKISQLMWDALTGPGGLKPHLDNLLGVKDQTPMLKAVVIPLEIKSLQKNK